MSDTYKAAESASPSLTSVEAMQINSTVQAPVPRQLLIEFTGSGSEYFRIWIVNLLLILVTLGFYLPWAKVRRFRYFYSNTLIDSDPLHFHGEPLQMFKGILIVLVLSMVFSLLGILWSEANLIYILVIAALWPALFRLTLRYRLSNTSWRGLRFAFGGTVKDAYGVCMPLLTPSILFGLIYVFFNDSADSSDVIDQDFKIIVWLIIALFILYHIAVLPWFFCRLKNYQHQNYCFSSEAAVFTAKAGDYYFIQLEWIGIFLVISIASFMTWLPFFWLSLLDRVPFWYKSFFMWPFSSICFLMIVLSLFVLLPSSIIGSVHNLVWGHTHSEHLRFSSTLRLKQMMTLSTRNWLLTLLTLGLYRPFAVIAMARLRLESVQIECSVDPSQWTVGSSKVQSNAVGVASGDFWGIDVGL